jgi:acyl-CoA synthetase (AMP-forming)/AMP-acid ligase II
MTEHWHFRWPSKAQALFASTASEAASAITVGYWLDQLAACRDVVSNMAGSRVLLYLDDSAEFSLWLFALLQAGKTVVLAPNGLPETLAQAVLHADEQLLADTALPAVNQDANSFANPDEITAHTSLPLQAQLVFFTSGSSGQPKLVSKALWQLQTEIQVLQQTFDCLAAHATSAYLWFVIQSVMATCCRLDFTAADDSFCRTMAGTGAAAATGDADQQPGAFKPLR